MTFALLWDLWRRGRWHLIILPAQLVLFAGLLLSIVPLDDAVTRQKLGLGILWVSMICLAVDFLHLAEGKKGEGCDARAFVLPVSTRRLAATRLAALSGLMMVSYLAGAISLRTALGIPGPEPVAMLLIGVAIAWIICCLWLTPRQPVRRGLALGLLGGVFAFSAWLRFPGFFSQPLASLMIAGVHDLALLGLLLAGAFPVAIWAVARQRRGEVVGGGQRWFPGSMARGSGGLAKKPFSSPFRALLWLDWREKGRLLPTLFLSSWTLLLVAAAVGLTKPADALAMAGAMISFTVFFGPVLVAGVICRVREGNLVAEIDPLRILRPVGDSKLASVYLTHGGVGLALAWGVAAVGALGMWALLGESPEAGLVRVVFARFVGAAGGDVFLAMVAGALVIAVAGWVQVGLLSALLLTGRTMSVTLLLGLPYLVGGAFLAFQDSVSRWPSEALLRSAPWIVGVLGLTGTTTALVLALQKRVVPKRATARQIGFLAVGLIVAATVFDFAWAPRTFAGFGIAVAVLAPWPAASLAVRWNRHR